MRVQHDFIWSSLVHLGTNLWYEEGNYRGGGTKVWETAGSSKLRFDRDVWDNHLQELKAAGVNTIILDVADGMVYDSHPEIAVEGAWTTDEMRAELDRLAEMGFEVIPKLNFSTCHDYWLGDYSRMISTPIYYQVCKDIINEVCDIFKPRFLHLGLDEECYDNQKRYDYCIIRQFDAWWHDILFLIDCVEKNGVRAMMWSDYARHRPEEFVQKMPKSVVQCVWYSFEQFGENLEEMYEIRVRPLHILEEHGYDQLPTGSTEYFRDNLRKLAVYSKGVISKEHLLGFMQTSWRSTTTDCVEDLTDTALTIKETIEAFEKA